MAKGLTIREKIGAIIGLLWLGSSLLLAKSVPFGIALGLLLGVPLGIFGNKQIKLTVFIFGVISLAAFVAVSATLQPIFKTHEAYFGIMPLYNHGFGQFIKAFSTWGFQHFFVVCAVPSLLVAWWFVAGTQFMLYFNMKETAEDKLLKMTEEHRPQEATKANFSVLLKHGYTPEAVPLGINLWKKGGKEPIYLPFTVLNKHVALVGTTGSGKTVTLYNFILSALAHKKAIVFIDGKGDIGNIRKFRKCCEDFGTTLHIVTLDGDTGYNPLSTGTPTELTDKLIGMFDWSEEHYKLGATRFLQLLIKYMQLADMPVTLGNIIKYSDYKTMLNYHLAHVSVASAGKSKKPATAGGPILPNFDEVPAAPGAAPNSEASEASEAEELIERIKSIDPKSISGVRDRLATLAEGDMAPMFNAPGALNLSEAIEQGEAVLFSVDSLRYPQQSKALGRLVTNDIKNCVSTHARNGAKPVGLFFDEFNVFASHEVVDIVNKSRSAGFEAVLSFQSLSDIDKLDNGEALRRQIIQNCNSLIVQLQNDSHDAEELSSLFGTYETTAVTVQEDETGVSGAGSRRKVHEFIVHPDDIKRLTVGQAFVKIGGVGTTKVQIVPN